MIRIIIKCLSFLLDTLLFLVYLNSIKIMKRRRNNPKEYKKIIINEIKNIILKVHVKYNT
jgi:hypothetical protein